MRVFQKKSLNFTKHDSDMRCVFLPISVFYVWGVGLLFGVFYIIFEGKNSKKTTSCFGPWWSQAPSSLAHLPPSEMEIQTTAPLVFFFVFFFWGGKKNVTMYHFSRQLWLVLGVKLMEINSNLFSRPLKKSTKNHPQTGDWNVHGWILY